MAPPTSSTKIDAMVGAAMTIEASEVDPVSSRTPNAMAMGAMGEEAAEALPAIWQRYVDGKMRHDQIAEILA